MGKWMQQTYTEVLPKSAIGMALAYTTQRWPRLMIYATDGKLNIDNNRVENCIGLVAASCYHIIGNSKRLILVLPKINEIYYHE
jgi:hypothetical protein